MTTAQRKPRVSSDENTLRDDPVFAAGDAVDCHAHIVGPAAEFPLARDSLYTPEEASTDDYLAVARRQIGVSFSVIVQPSFYAVDNRCTIDAARALGAACSVAVVPLEVSAEKLLSLKAQGVRGLRLNSAVPGHGVLALVLPDGRLDGRLIAFVERARLAGLHLEFYQRPEAWASLLGPLDAVGATWVLDHLGMIPASQGLRSRPFDAVCEALTSSRGWIKFSAFYRLSTQSGHADLRPMVERLYSVAPERCVWGSDWPHTFTDGKPDASAQLQTLLGWLPDDQSRRAVLVDNPRRLYRLVSDSPITVPG